MNIKPFQQGQLDALCGIYCVINVVQALHGSMTEEKAEDLFKWILKKLDKEIASTNLRLIEGMSYIELSKALSHTSPLYPIRWERPYHRKRTIGIDEYWEHMQSHCADPRGVIISYITTEGFCDHWTVIDRVTDRTMFLLDSGGDKRIYRRHCTVDWQQLRARILIRLHACFFVFKEDKHHA